MTFIEGLGLVLPRAADATSSLWYLEDRRSLTDNDCGKVSCELDRQWESVLSHTQEIGDERFLLLRREVLLISTLLYDRRSAIVAMPKRSCWDPTSCGAGFALRGVAKSIENSRGGIDLGLRSHGFRKCMNRGNSRHRRDRRATRKTLKTLKTILQRGSILLARFKDHTMIARESRNLAVNNFIALFMRL